MLESGDTNHNFPDVFPMARFVLNPKICNYDRKEKAPKLKFWKL